MDNATLKNVKTIVDDVYKDNLVKIVLFFNTFIAFLNPDEKTLVDK